MTLTLRNNIRLLCFFVLSVFVVPLFANGQGSVSLSVSPTLFDISASENQSWTSTVKVINTNPFPLKVYLNGVNFEPAGESGQGNMVPVFESEATGTTLAEWLDLPTDEIVIPAEQTVSVPFTITVPTGAAPGGHFAAILVGTRSLTTSDAPAQVETSQVVTSLVFLRVAGDIIERGSIRDFITTRSLNETPQATFEIRFENAGNVHLQPQGDITIKNMWGKERGIIPINQTSQFGNVLPESVRKYSFEWSGEWSFSEIGRYTAQITLAYGDETRQFVTAETAFWVIPWRTLILILAVFGGLLYLIIWGIKLYIRKMLQLAGITPELHYTQTRAKRTISVTAPLEEGILDLRAELTRKDGGTLPARLLHLVRKYKLFLIVVSAMLVLVSLFIWYLLLALSPERGFEVRIEQDGEMVVVPDAASATDLDGEQAPSVEGLVLTIVNRSGIAGLDELRALDLQSKGYEVEVGRADAAVDEDRTVIVYDPAFADSAVALQQYFKDSLLSSFISPDASENPITIYLGTDQIQ